MQEFWILLLDVDIDRDFYVLVNFYNNNVESDKRHTFPELNNFLNKIADISIKKNLGGEFNLFFDSLKETVGGNPFFKKDQPPK